MKQELLLICSGPVLGCTEVVEIPFDEPLTRDRLTELLRARNWFLSVVTPPGQGRDVPIDFAAICEPCAKVVMPELVEAAKKARGET